MLPCPNFLSLLNGAVEARPDSMICFFSMRGVLLEAKDQGLSWIETENGLWGGAMVMPTDYIPQWLKWERANVKPDYPWDDTRMKLWAEHAVIPRFITAPSLAQHEGAAVSLVGNANRRRVSPWVSDGSPVDWSTDAIRRKAYIPQSLKDEALL